MLANQNVVNPEGLKPNVRSGDPSGAAAWKIARRGAGCAACARAFEEGNLVFSSLRIDGESATVSRLDRCGVCHQKRQRDAAEIIWRTQFHAEPKKAKLDLNALAEIFRQLAPKRDPRWRDFVYLVTLLLLRHRKLRVSRTRTEESKDYLIVVFGKQKQQFDVEVADLTAERMEALRAQMLALFEGAAGALLIDAPPDHASDTSGSAVAERAGGLESAPASN
jgi:hypothetical protein